MPNAEQPTPHRTEPLIDFDSWSELARNDPQAFETRRAEMIEDMINKAPEHRRHRLRCLQWKIDHVRELADNPAAACVKLSELMWNALAGPGGLNEVLQQCRQGDFTPPHQARVLPLPPQR